MATTNHIPLQASKMQNAATRFYCQKIILLTSWSGVPERSMTMSMLSKVVFSMMMFSKVTLSVMMPSKIVLSMMMPTKMMFSITMISYVMIISFVRMPLVTYARIAHSATLMFLMMRPATMRPMAMTLAM